MIRFSDLPLIVILIGVGAAAMFVPAVYAAAIGEWRTVQVFGISAVLFLFLTAVLSIALANHRSRSPERSHLMGLVAAFTLLPAMLAVPFEQVVQSTTFTNAWFEMVSSATTTGATLFAPDRLSMPLHLWRALVGWMGGFLIWVSAFALLAPMNLGGFEVISSERMGSGARPVRRQGTGGLGEPRERMLRYTLDLLPIYVGLTAVLWTALVLVGERSIVAVCHAMATLSTSGISPIGGLENSSAGLMGEGLIFIFLVFAITRATFMGRRSLRVGQHIHQDPELQIGIALLVLVPSFLFLRHWIGAYEVDTVSELPSALNALWGAAFSVISFLTTTGFVSSEWDVSSAWSGLQTPGMILLGLALIGGGVATTAGGVKLLRVYALYKHSAREMERLVYPSSIGGSGGMARQIRKQGAYVAWIFFMLFALSIAVVALMLAASERPFDEAIVMSVAALSTTGPAAGVVLDRPVTFAGLNDMAKFTLMFAMALGRVETLAILALFNPQFWRS